MSPSTPRYGHAPLLMKRVQSFGEVDHVGDFFWRFTDEGARYITLALPRPRPNAPDDYIMNDLPVAKGINRPSECWGWDGNEDVPTLVPSIHCVGHWHGFVRVGMLIED